MIKKEKINNLLTTNAIATVMMSRINYRNHRLYVTEKPFGIYSGLTGALSCATFKGNEDSKRIVKWRDKMINHLGSIEKQESFLQSMADFGTLTHECIVKVWEKKEIDWVTEKEMARSFFENSAKNNNIDINESVLEAQITDYCKSVSSLMQFLYDMVDEIYSVEGMCKCDELMIATPVDIVCKLKSGKVATLNIKTSSQISHHQKEQVAMEMYLWNKTYENCKADVTGIIRPKDWMIKKGNPTYEFVLLTDEEQYNLVSQAKTRLLLSKNDETSTYLNYPKESHVFKGITKLGEKPIIECLSLEELLTKTDCLICDLI